uniref:Actin-related protein 2/3 complex subunit n=1 Tax=Phallusia mammillata TaxID=59560 RepID=A0A6F9D641_9ASCI|nr:actin-related protein 2/3 complex subunit 1A [Phallusia mammillata]
MADVSNFGVKPISCHAFNHDRSQLALSLNDNDVQIYKKSGKKWDLIHTLSEHTLKVTGIDWAPKTNRIVTCGADRNAYVWQLTDGVWVQELVILRINRAATCVKWSPEEDKFAVGSSSRMISICYFESDNNWWVSKHIKKPIRSTIVTLDWHPNNILLAAGCCDYKAYVFSAYIKEINAKPGATVWGKKMNFGNIMQEVVMPCTGWVHGVSFSPSGNRLAMVSHGSIVSVVTGGAELVGLRTEHLPFNDCIWITENSFVAAGHDCNPMLFTVDGGCTKVDFSCKLDQPPKAGGGGRAVSAMNMFKMMDKKGAVETGGKEIDTKHKNAITQLYAYGPNKFSSAGKDGNVIVWDAKSLESSIAGLRIA